jgi:hypothetical protein
VLAAANSVVDGSRGGAAGSLQPANSSVVRIGAKAMRINRFA